MALTGHGRPPQPPRADYLAAHFDALWRASFMPFMLSDSTRATHILRPHWPKSDSLLVCLEAHFFLFPLILRAFAECQLTKAHHASTNANKLPIPLPPPTHTDIACAEAVYMAVSLLVLRQIKGFSSASSLKRMMLQ
ncbi:uncharacterized protein EI90DRAFT_3132878 [Cantharellus anzutake]|uniref:uncharacterized protein n=1 Tax=Cantharellus anzutake TaxID=1750568 RepID=UPI001904779A|nr:uncharacterized protein EI90DRAFT_3132878 [Cantharellus anzutake]KAF8318900.1 hypothetical protein EI90DRAFT_3132878 [Cantharellus anzutake]